MGNQPNTWKDSQIDRKPPTDKETGVTSASEHAVQYNVVSNSFWALLHWVISIWRFGFGRQKPQDDQRPSTVVSDNQVCGNTGVYNGRFSVGNSMQMRARKKDKASYSNSSASAQSSPPSQKQISEDDKPEDDQEPRNIVVSGNLVKDNKGRSNGNFSVGNRLL